MLISVKSEYICVWEYLYMRRAKIEENVQDYGKVDFSMGDECAEGFVRSE